MRYCAIQLMCVVIFSHIAKFYCRYFFSPFIHSFSGVLAKGAGGGAIALHFEF